jgi:formylglycine-generating enzyme required for sulfatase activity
MRYLALAACLIPVVVGHGHGDEPVNEDPAPVGLLAPFDLPTAMDAQKAWTRHLKKPSYVEKNSIGMELILIPAGTFRMGSPLTERDRGKMEAQVDVTLTRPFYLGIKEVTQGQWRAVMGTRPWKRELNVAEGDTFPATCISWTDAQEFCRKMSEKEKIEYRLPTEAEWEYACRAGTTTRFSFGESEDELSDHAWWGALIGKGGIEREHFAHQVGQKMPNAFGLYDMHGNVWEWCEDYFADQLPGKTDPLVVDGASSAHVVRGGGWSLAESYCRSAFRSWYAAKARINYLGFRVAFSAVQE